MRCLKEAILSMFNAMQSFLLFLFCIFIILVLPECEISFLVVYFGLCCRMYYYVGYMHEGRLLMGILIMQEECLTWHCH